MKRLLIIPAAVLAVCLAGCAENPEKPSGSGGGSDKIQGSRFSTDQSTINNSSSSSNTSSSSATSSISSVTIKESAPKSISETPSGSLPTETSEPSSAVTPSEPASTPESSSVSSSAEDSTHVPAVDAPHLQPSKPQSQSSSTGSSGSSSSSKRPSIQELLPNVKFGGDDRPMEYISAPVSSYGFNGQDYFK